MSNVKDFAKIAASFISEEVTSRVLGLGDHRCVLTKAVITHSMMTNKGEVKENKETEYEDVTGQVYVEFGSTAGEGAIAHRYQLEGFVAYEDLTPKEKESGRFTASSEGYAMIQKNGKFFRINSEEKTAACHRILSQAFKVFGLPTGSTLENVQDVIDNKTEFIVNVKMNKHDEKESPVVNYLKEVTEEVEITEQFK